MQTLRSSGTSLRAALNIQPLLLFWKEKQLSRLSATAARVCQESKGRKERRRTSWSNGEWSSDEKHERQRCMRQLWSVRVAAQAQQGLFWWVGENSWRCSCQGSKGRGRNNGRHSRVLALWIRASSAQRWLCWPSGSRGARWRWRQARIGNQARRTPRKQSAGPLTTAVEPQPCMQAKNS